MTWYLGSRCQLRLSQGNCLYFQPNLNIYLTLSSEQLLRLYTYPASMHFEWRQGFFESTLVNDSCHVRGRMIKMHGTGHRQGSWKTESDSVWHPDKSCCFLSQHASCLSSVGLQPPWYHLCREETGAEEVKQMQPPENLAQFCHLLPVSMAGTDVLDSWRWRLKGQLSPVLRNQRKLQCHRW